MEAATLAMIGVAAYPNLEAALQIRPSVKATVHP
jgi:hypothetical protein